MQSEIGNEVHIGAIVSPFARINKYSAIDRTAWELISTGAYDADIAKCIRRILDLVY